MCVDVCPISAISPGDPIYVIDDTCCDFEECLIACPEDAIVPIADIAGDGASENVEVSS